MSQVNFIQNFRLFMEFSKRSKLTSHERMFYIALFYQANDLAMQDENHDWPDDYFPVSNSELTALTNFDERAIRNTRNALKQKGLLDFKKGNGKKADPEYQIFYMGRVGYKITPICPSAQTTADKYAVDSFQKKDIDCENAPDTVGDSVGDTVGNPVVIDCENAPDSPIYNNIYKNINKKQNININSNPNLIQQDEMRADEPAPYPELVYEELIKQNINYEDLLVSHKDHEDLINELVDLLLETVLSKREYIQIAGDLRPAALVKKRMLKLNYWHIEYILQRFDENVSKIQNVKQYLLAMLFNAPATMDAHYRSLVQQDM